MKWKRITVITLAVLSAASLSGCRSSDEKTNAENGTEKLTLSSDAALTIGFAQVGEESDWRRANSRSILDTFSVEKGYNLLFEDAQNNPDLQMTAVQKFIQEGVDYILLEPIIETGWDSILAEVKEAGIPLIVADRQVKVEDEDLVTAWVGSDTKLEGMKACEWLHAYCRAKNIAEEDLKIVNIQGTIGSSPQIGRESALKEEAGRYGWKLLGTSKGEFTQAKGREAMEDLLERFPDLNVVYCDNDNEAYGAIEALKEADVPIGTDIASGEVMILCFDATRQGLEYVKEGLIACDAEDNPLHGPRVEEIIQKLESGGTVDKIQYVEEKIFAADDTVSSVTIDGKEYEVIPVTDEVLAGREY